jgi:hypothetical protein
MQKLKAMKLLETIYWLRLALGITAAVICAGYGIAAGEIAPIDPVGEFSVDYPFFMTSLFIALVIYLISYYIIKSRFLLRVEKPRKLVTTGIGIYFLSWLFLWVLLYTMIGWVLSSG